MNLEDVGTSDYYSSWKSNVVKDKKKGLQRPFFIFII